MASIILKTFKGGNVSPLNDAILWQTALPGAGIFKGCEVTAARGNILHISQGYGIIKGRFFELYENEVSVGLAETGQTLNGRLYIHMDLSNADEPVKIIAETAETLASLLMDANVNYNNSSYDLELATFKVDAAGVIDLTQVFPTVQAGSGGGGGAGGGGLARDTAYEIGDIVTCANAPGWCFLVCIQRGATAISEPIGYTQIQKGGDKVLDGTCVFQARDIIAELDDAIHLADEVSDLEDVIEAMRSDSSAVVIKLISIADYKALSTYDNNTLYYCYENAETRQITAIYLGEHTVYATGIDVNYHIDTDTVIKKVSSLSNDAISEAPTAALEGYIFVGWRDDDTPSKTVLKEKIIDTEDGVNLYAVFKRTIEIGMLDNGATLMEDAEETTLTDTLYYNNGNALSEGITIPECPYEWEGKVFCGWNTDSVSDPTYEPGEKGQFTDDCYLFPMFTDAEYDFPYTGTYFPFTIPATGIYEFELYGASGANATATLDNVSVTGKGGKGGHVKAYKKMNKGDLIYVCNGGKANNTSSGYNGGGSGYTYTSGSKHIGAGGGGASHIALQLGTLGQSQSGSSVSKSLTYTYRENILLVAGGGGGAGVSMTEFANTSGAINGGYTKGPHDGGDGGGDRGGDGSGGALGGRQSSTGTSADTNFGKGASNSSTTITSSGGGGGWFGGNIGTNGNSGAGGSGYTGGMPSFTYKKKYYRAINEAGKNEGNGYCFIRYVQCAL